MKTSRVLVTGFQAFGKHNVNSSEIMVRRLSSEPFQNIQLVTAILPVTWQGCVDFCSAIRDIKRYDAVLMTGLNAGIRYVALEQYAVNIQRSKNPDNAGLYRRRNTAIVQRGPDIVESRLDVSAIAHKITRKELPVRPSFHAGTFICNTLYYTMLHKTESTNVPALFVHLPEIENSEMEASLVETLKSIVYAVLAKRRYHTIKKTGIDSMQKAEKFLYSFVNYERKTGVVYSETNYNLDRYRQFLAKQDDPQNRGRSIHVAGTKGKGCVCAIIASVLSANGYKTGLYTSPHLVDIRERFRLDGKAISERDFIRLAAWQASMIGTKKDASGRSYRTTFELLTAMAFQYFSARNTDWDVFETGMGGRLDCTNVVHPIVSAITRVDIDHTDSLGATRLKIAGEKAGIIKPGIPVVFGRQAPVVARFLKAYADNTPTKSIFSLSEILVKNVVFTPDGTRFSVKILGKWHHGFQLDLPGLFQLDNCRHALAVLQYLAASNQIELKIDALREGISRVRWPGRFMVVDGERFHAGLKGLTIVVDGAHNRYAVGTLLQSVRRLYPDRPITVIFGCSANKDASAMVKELSPFVKRMIVTAYHNPRAMPVDKLERIAIQYGIPVSIEPDVKSAVNNFKTGIMEDEIVIVTGSLYLVGESLELAGLTKRCLNIY